MKSGRQLRQGESASLHQRAVAALARGRQLQPIQGSLRDRSTHEKQTDRSAHDAPCLLEQRIFFRLMSASLRKRPHRCAEPKWRDAPEATFGRLTRSPRRRSQANVEETAKPSDFAILAKPPDDHRNSTAIGAIST